MDSSRKRKAQTLSATPTTNEGSATKKIKLLNSNPKPSADRSVLAIGTKLIAQLSNATDKTGRHITDAFLELPPRDELPDYYQIIGLPISIGMIEEKLQTNGYPSVSALESDFKRMIQNAKDYNEPKSEIYEDAERIRKLIYNYMKLNNPAYQDSNYSAVATPVPGSSTRITLTNGAHRAQPAQPAHSKTTATHTPTVAPVVKDERASKEDGSKLRLSLGPRVSEKAAEKHSEPPSERKSASVAPSAPDRVEDETMDFTGKSFQEAQQMIVAEMIRYTDDEGLEIFTPFVYLPSRKLEDYYRYIKHPVSLKSVQKRIRGQHGREPPTGISDFKTWDAFEQEVSFIWRNARDYNEDGSDMYNLAGDLETHFKSRLAEAKEVVKEPQSARIKLGGPQQQTKSGVTLNLSQHRASPSPSIAVDNDALARQRNMVMAGVNGSSSQPNARPALNGFARQSSVGPIRPPSSGQPGSPVKNEKLATMSPGPRIGAPAVQPTTNGMMPPPMIRASSGTPFAAQPAPPVNSYSYTAPSLLPPTAIRQYPASEALLPLVTIHTHPQLKVAKPFSVEITPHASLSHQSATVTLPATHFFLQIQPTISRELALNRAYKIFVTMNGTRLTQRDTTYHQDTGKRTHSYDGNLAHGVNRIEIEVAAAKAGDNGDGKGLDIEKVTVYASLIRT